MYRIVYHIALKQFWSSNINFLILFVTISTEYPNNWQSWGKTNFKFWNSFKIYVMLESDVIFRLEFARDMSLLLTTPLQWHIGYESLNAANSVFLPRLSKMVFYKETSIAIHHDFKNNDNLLYYVQIHHTQRHSNDKLCINTVMNGYSFYR